MIRIGIDTSILIGRLDLQDIWHGPATALKQALKAQGADVAVFDCILADVPMLYTEIVELVRSSGGELNFNDALIALSCRHREIPLLASFDRDFDRLNWLRRVAAPEDLV